MKRIFGEKKKVLFSVLSALVISSAGLSFEREAHGMIETGAKEIEVLPATGAMYTPNVSSLNLRSGPGTHYKKTGQVNKGALLEEISTTKSGGTTWSKVKYKGKTHYASKSYLTLSSGKSTSTSSSKTTTSKKNTSKYKANHIYYGSKAIPYKNVGMSRETRNGKEDWLAQRTIDTTKNAATFGGVSTFSGTDKKNTHFIGHNPGQFSGMHNQSKFIVTDSVGNVFTYKKTSLYVVDEYGINVKTKVDKWDRITGASGGERIVLQSTKKHPTKYIVEAELVKSEFK